MDRERTGHGATRSSESGFTLLEVLVALVVLGILLATLAQGMRVGFHAWTLGQRIGGRADTLEATDRTLRQLVGRAATADPVTRDRGFTGMPAGMAFTTTMPDALAPSAPGAVAPRASARLPLEADVSVLLVEGHRLILRWIPHHARWLIPPPLPVTETLLDGVATVQFAYFQQAADGHGGRWLASWSGVDLPRLIRLHVAFFPGDARHWPDLVLMTMRERAPP